MPTNSIEIREVEGAERWGVVLRGRALPKRDDGLEFGSNWQAEDSFPHGQGSGTTEPIALQFPDIALKGEWKRNFLLAGDATIETHTGTQLRDPQAACNFLEAFARRGKVVEVTWSGGVRRICRWEGFTFGIGRGPDRTWNIKFKVLGASLQAQASVPRSTPRAHLQGLQSSAGRLEEALAGKPASFTSGNIFAMVSSILGAVDQTYVDLVRGAFAAGLEQMAGLRRVLAQTIDLGRAPLDQWRQLEGLAKGAHASLLDGLGVLDSLPFEDRIEGVASAADAALRAQLWVDGIRSATDAQIDAILAVIDEAERRIGQTSVREVPVQPGDSIPRIVGRELGAGADWSAVAAQNGIAGQLVPPGVSTLRLPVTSVGG